MYEGTSVRNKCGMRNELKSKVQCPRSQGLSRVVQGHSYMRTFVRSSQARRNETAKAYEGSQRMRNGEHSPRSRVQGPWFDARRRRLGYEHRREADALSRIRLPDPSLTEPLLARHPRLPQEPGKEAHADLALMRIREDHGHSPAAHLRMTPPGIWPVKAQLTEPSHQVGPRYRGQIAHGGVPRPAGRFG